MAEQPNPEVLITHNIATRFAAQEVAPALDRVELGLLSDCISTPSLARDPDTRYLIYNSNTEKPLAAILDHKPPDAPPKSFVEAYKTWWREFRHDVHVGVPGQNVSEFSLARGVITGLLGLKKRLVVSAWSGAATVTGLATVPFADVYPEGAEHVVRYGGGAATIFLGLGALFASFRYNRAQRHHLILAHQYTPFKLTSTGNTAAE